MSFSLAVQNGDLVLSGSNLAIVSGTDLLKQSLQLWVAERYGGDRFHPAMGSVLQEYIGGVITPRTKMVVYSEVMRVLENYIKVQGAGFSANPRLYNLAELLSTINDCKVDIAYDTVTVSVSVSSAGGSNTLITVSQGV